MAQVLESLQILNTKVDYMATRLLLVEIKVRELKKKMHFMRMRKGEWEKKEEKEE